jgi:hypothetical protein
MEGCGVGSLMLWTPSVLLSSHLKGDIAEYIGTIAEIDVRVRVYG